MNDAPGARARSGAPGVWFLRAIGLFFLVVAIFGGVRERLERLFGVERALAVAAAFLFFYVSALIADRNRLRVEIRDFFDQVLVGVYGKNYRQQREAIDILVNALQAREPTARKTAAEQLKRLTGQNFGEDHQAWSQWWEANRRTYRADAAGLDPRAPKSR